MFRETIREILENVWPMLLIFVTIIVSIRIAYLLRKKENFIFYKEILGLGFIIYILCLFYVVTFQDVSWSTSNFIPFREIFRYEINSRLFLKNVIGNMIMFMPYGFFVSYYLHLEKPYWILFLSLITSFAVETTQLAIGRVFDIDDIFLNVCGGFIGYLGYRFLYEIKDHLPNFLKNAWFYNIMIVILLILGFLYLFEILQVSI